MINGPFDADKLDYLQRDAHFTGLGLGVNLERIYYAAGLVEDGGPTMGLCSDISGAPALEQVLFDKMLLYAQVYHHHKVRAAGCMYRALFEIITDYGIDSSLA